MRAFPSNSIAEGWYQIGWSSDFPAGTVKPVSYFERELVVFRGESGALHVLDAFCRHMGAHLGHGGCVERDSIRCPYHGWLYDGVDGRNTEIPYSEPDKMGNLQLRRWETREIDDVVLVYYSHDGAAPSYDPPDAMIRFDGETWPICAETTKMWLDEPISPQYMAENAADGAHFKYVHRAKEVADVGNYEVNGGLFRARVDIRFGGHTESTWATPHGPVDGHIITENWGIGLGWSRLQGFDDVIYLLGITPITPYRADLRSTCWVARKRADGSDMNERTRDLWVAQQNHQVDSDLEIWRHMSYIDRAPWAKAESQPMRALRRWAKQFYRQEHTEHAASARGGS